MSWRIPRVLVGLLAAALALTGLVAVPAASHAATAACALACDTLDPSKAKQDTFPVPNRDINGRTLKLHVSDPDNMTWASIDNGTTGDTVWLDRSWDRGATWEPVLGKASIPATWTGTRTLMYNISDPVGHRRGWIRACGDAGAVTCTDWAYPKVCDGSSCDGASPATAAGDDTGMQFSGGYGAAPGAWRLPGANLNSYTDMDQFARYAQAAERGKIQLLFIADIPVLDVDLDHHAPHHMIDPLLILTVLARETERIGLVTTASTTFTEPYNLARQFKALDVISHGRAGWNAVTTSDPAAAANFGATIPPRAEKYERAHEVIQIVQGLWGSWEKDAWLLDVDGKRFADMDKIQPANLQGKHAASRGPLPIPPSEQGMTHRKCQRGCLVSGRHSSMNRFHDSVPPLAR